MKKNNKSYQRLFILIILFLSALFHILVLRFLLAKKKEAEKNKEFKINQDLLKNETASQVVNEPKQKEEDEKEQKVLEQHTGGLPIFLNYQLDSSPKTSSEIILKDGEKSKISEQEEQPVGENETEPSHELPQTVTEPTKDENEFSKSTSGDFLINKKIEELNKEKSDDMQEIKNENQSTQSSDRPKVKRKRRKILSDRPKPIIQDFIKNFEQGFSIDGTDNQDVFRNDFGFSEGSKGFCYKQRIFDSILKSIKIVGFRKQIRVPSFNEPRLRNGILVNFHLIINKNGTLKTGTVSCGISKLEDFLMEAVNYAAPFPPIPDHLKQETYEIYMPITFVLNDRRHDQTGPTIHWEN